MKISIIDIGTQSLKHYIFAVVGDRKTPLHYKRYSEANLGEAATITHDAIERTLQILKECLTTNKTQGVAELEILGTEILRKAGNAQELIAAVSELTGRTIQVISQDEEAKLLYQGFIDIVPGDVAFAAMNIGGGSTEVVVGTKGALIESQKIPFGAKLLEQLFLKSGVMDWQGLDAYLEQEISMKQEAGLAFVTGVLDFISTVGPHLGITFTKNDTPNHPIRLSLDAYIEALGILRATPIDELKTIYTKDPGFCEKFAIGQSVYVAIARQLGARTIVPSNNDLTDGVIYGMTHDLAV